MFSILSIIFYTGQTPLRVFANLANNVSVYYEYQNYFMQQQRNVFSITKIPFILMMFYVKFVFLYSYVSIFLLKKSITKFEKIYLIFVTI